MVLEIEGRSAVPHCVDNWLRERLWASRKTDYEVNEWMRCA